LNQHSANIETKKGKREMSPSWSC